MAVYHYRAKDDKGQTTQGRIDALTKYEALSQLYQRDLTVVQMEEEIDGRRTVVKLPPVKVYRGLFARRVRPSSAGRWPYRSVRAYLSVRRSRRL